MALGVDTHIHTIKYIKHLANIFGLNFNIKYILISVLVIFFTVTVSEKSSAGEKFHGFHEISMKHKSFPHNTFEQWLSFSTYETTPTKVFPTFE